MARIGIPVRIRLDCNARRTAIELSRQLRWRTSGLDESIIGWRSSAGYGSGALVRKRGQAEGNELARALFAPSQVTNVFYVDRWLTVTQDGKADWKQLARQIAVPLRAAMAASDQSAAGVVAAQASFAHLSEYGKDRFERSSCCSTSRSGPFCKTMAATCTSSGWRATALVAHYQGACGSRPSSISGTLGGIENLLRTIEPQIEVVAA